MRRADVDADFAERYSRHLRLPDVGLDGQKTLEASRVLARTPQAMQLRYLQTLTSIAGDKSSTIVFPMPVELAETFASLVARKAADDGG